MPSIYLILLIIILDEVTEANLNVEHLRLNPRGPAGSTGNSEGGMIGNLKDKLDGGIMASIQGILGLSKGNADDQLASLQGLLDKSPGMNADDLVASIQGLLGKPPHGAATVGPTKGTQNSKVMHMYRDGQPIIQPRIMRVVVPEGVSQDEEKRMISHVASLNQNMPLGLLRFMTYRNQYTVLNLPPHLRKILLPFIEK